MGRGTRKMFLKELLMLFIGFCAGIGVASGTFAFLLVIRVVPRIIQKAGMQKKIIYVENMLIYGILFGTILSVVSWQEQWLFALLGRLLLIIFGICAGMFVGCTAVALAEILDTFPIFFRRTRLDQKFDRAVLFSMAAGKTCGALFYFFCGYGLPGA